MIGAWREPSRCVAFGAVIALHAAALAGLLALEPLRRVLEPVAYVEAVLMSAPAADSAAPDPAPHITDAIVTPLVVAEPELDVVERELEQSGAIEEPARALPSSAGGVVMVAPAAVATDSTDVVPQVDAVQYLVAPAPRYPPVSRRLREQGTVWLQVLVDVAGLPAAVTVIQSSGSLRLDEAALRALSATRFQPYLHQGRASPVYVRVPVEFSLRRG
jgi:protein TonB